MQITYEERLNRLIAVILIAILTIADVIAIGADFASLALDMVATTNNNVEFEAYFKDENGEKISEKEIDLNAEKVNMYVDISILREGYFNGKIFVEDSNFSIIRVTENSYVQGFEESEVKLNQIRSGENITIEMQVKPKTYDTMNPEILNKESKVNLEGKYTSSKGEENVRGTTFIKAKYVTPKDSKGVLEAEVLTNKVLEVDGANKRVLQLLVKSQIENNIYPASKNNITLTFPSGAESIEAIARGTDATNNKIQFGESNLNKDLSESKLEIKVENNKDENGNISFKQNAKDEFVVTCIYPEDKIFKNMKELVKALEENEQIKEEDKKEAQVQVSQEITTYDEKKLKSNIEVNLEIEKDGIINYELIQEENEFYKGKIYSGEERDYNIKLKANINSIKVERNINFTLEDTNYLEGENKKTSKIVYKTIEIKKDELTETLGEDGYLTVKDENNTIIANITKETITNETILIEDNNITIKIPENAGKIKIETSNVIRVGKIEFKITKAITEKEYTRDEIKLFTAIENKITVGEETISKNIELNETSTDASLEVNKDILQKGKNENVLITATLLTNEESKDLYKNPVIKILFPKGATEVKPKYKMLYNKDGENELEIVNAIKGIEDGRTVLTVTLNGEQSIYPGSAIDGITILVNADITIGEQATEGKDDIIMKYTNEKAISYSSDKTEEKLTLGIKTKELEIKDSPTLRINNTRATTTVSTENNITSKLEITVSAKTEGPLKKGYLYYYNINVKNISEETIENIEIELKFNNVFTNDFNKITIDKLEAGENKKREIGNTVSNDEFTEKQGIIEANSAVKVLDEEKNIEVLGFTSQPLKIDVENFNIETNIEVKFPIEKNTFYNEEMFSYKIRVTNKGEYDINNIEIRDIFSKNLEIQNVNINNQNADYLILSADEDDYMMLNLETRINKNETIEIYITVIVKAENINTLTKIKNKAKIYSYSKYIGETKEKTVNIIKSKDLIREDENKNEEIIPKVEEIENNNADKSDDEKNKDKTNEDTQKDEGNKIDSEDINNKNNNKDDKTTSESTTFKVSGQVWAEENGTGNKKNSIEKISGINVFLIDVDEGKIVKGNDGNKISAVTNNEGEYSLVNIQKGKYIVGFEYDTNTYSPTEYHKQEVDDSNNSDAVLKKIIIDGEERIIAVTDILNINSNINNIDLGVIKLKKFDLELTKVVDKITVTNRKGTMQYDFNNSSLAKVEIPANYLEGSIVEIEYSIKIKNNGDISGYAKNIVDYLPTELIFEQEKNTGWTKEGDYIYNSSLANDIIKSGQTRELKLILTKTMTDSNTGLISNVAEIAEEYNSLEIFDTNSTPLNRKTGENDMGQADVIIGVKTGIILRATLLGIALLVICGIIIECSNIKKSKK